MASTSEDLPWGLQELHLLDEDARKWLGLMDGGGDVVTSKWLGLDSIVIPLSIVAVYLSFIFTAHQRIKQVGLPIKPVLIIYNFIQVGVNLFVTKKNSNSLIFCQ